MLQNLCEAGLPNFSRPDIVRKSDLGCNILGPKRRVKGVLRTGFEASNFISDQLGPAPGGGGFTKSTWFTCNQSTGCDGRLDAELERSAKAACGTGMATIIVEGWPTVTRGHYGHLGVYAREFFMDRIVAVGPPPPSDVSQWNAALRRDGIGKRWCEELESNAP
jgi:hypothetical protein